MARLEVSGQELILRLNPAEKALDLRIPSPRVPLSAIRSVDVLQRPGYFLDAEVDFGFAGNTAPGRRVFTVMSRGRYRGGRAAVFVYRNRPSVRVTMEGGRWLLFVVSRPVAADEVTALRAALFDRQSKRTYLPAVGTPFPTHRNDLVTPGVVIDTLDRAVA